MLIFFFNPKNPPLGPGFLSGFFQCQPCSLWRKTVLDGYVNEYTVNTNVQIKNR